MNATAVPEVDPFGMDFDAMDLPTEADREAEFEPAPDAFPAAIDEPPRVAWEPGIYRGVSFETYCSIDAINQSTLQKFRRTPAHALDLMERPRKVTEEMRLGTVIHAYLLEPERFRKQYIEVPDFATGLTDKTGKPYTRPKLSSRYKQLIGDFARRHADKQFLQPGDLEVCRGIAESIAASAEASRLLTIAADAEVAIVWRDHETGLLCKALIDRLVHVNGQRIIVDVKSTDDAGPDEFGRHAWQMGYHLQAAWYLWGMASVGEPAHQFVHVVCETSPPYAVSVCELDDDSLDAGLALASGRLRVYAECVRTGRWPAYADGVHSVRIPKWGFE
jgi:hypothetical protein